MTARVDPQARSFEGSLRQEFEIVQRIEQQHKLDPSTSLEIGALLDNVRPFFVASSLPIIAPLYYRMSMAILVAPGEEMFITSDSPTAWNNPEAYKWPPFYRSPGLAQEGIEVTLPLTPRYALLLSHNDKISGYKKATDRLVNEMNRRTRFHCDQFFVSWKGEIRDYWFEQPTLPDDAWENSPGGLEAAKRKREDEELKRRYLAELSKADQSG